MNLKSKRESLISQVKEIYAGLADRESREGFVQNTAEPTPEAFYEELLNSVLAGIDSGEYDGFADGREIVDFVANRGEYQI